MKNTILILLLFLTTSLFSKNVQDLKKLTETQAYEIIERGGGILESIKGMTDGSKKTLANNNGRIQIDNTAFITAYQSREYTQITKIILLKAKYTTKFANDNKISEIQAENFLRRDDVRNEILGQMKAVNINTYCPLTIFKVLFKEKFIMEFVYQYDDGELFGSYTVDYGDCPQSDTSIKKMLIPALGFNDIKWGSNLDNISEFIIIKTDKYGKYYSRNNDIAKVFGVSMDSITYKTHKNKFYLTNGKFSSKKNYNLLLEALTKKLGKPWGFNKDLKKEDASWNIYSSTQNNKKEQIARVVIKIDYLNQVGEFIWVNTKYRPDISLYWKK